MTDTGVDRSFTAAAPEILLNLQLLKMMGMPHFLLLNRLQICCCIIEPDCCQIAVDCCQIAVRLLSDCCQIAAAATESVAFGFEADALKPVAFGFETVAAS